VVAANRVSSFLGLGLSNGLLHLLNKLLPKLVLH